jgi:hypothetical protein
MPYSHKEHARPYQLPGCICHTRDCPPAAVRIDVFFSDSATPEVYIGLKEELIRM